MRPVAVAGVGLFCPAGIGTLGATGGRPGEVPGFRARAYIAERKNLKLMSRAVKLGVSAIAVALADSGKWDTAPPERRGMFVGSTPIGGEMADLIPALEAAMNEDASLDLGRFARKGYHLIHPLWLVKGLSNNVLGFASATHDFQGVNANYCDGDASGEHALTEGWAAVAEGRADVVVAGASDSWVGLEQLLPGRKCSEGAAFFVLKPATGGEPWVLEPATPDAPGEVLPEEDFELGYLGAADVVGRLARALLRGERPSFSGAGMTLRFR